MQTSAPHVRTRMIRCAPEGLEFASGTPVVEMLPGLWSVWHYALWAPSHDAMSEGLGGTAALS